MENYQWDYANSEKGGRTLGRATPEAKLVSKVSFAPQFDCVILPGVRDLVATPNAADASPSFLSTLDYVWMLERGWKFNIYLPRWHVGEKYESEGTARNDCVRVFKAVGGDFLLFVDSDCLILPGTLRSLRQHQIEGIVGAWFWSHDHSAPVHVPHQPQWSGLRRLEGEKAWTGISCMLIHRNVFKVLADPWFPNGKEYGGWQDKIICQKAMAAGFPVCVDTDTYVWLEDRRTK